MKTGRSLQDLAAEIERQQAVKRDYVARTDALEMVGDNGDVALAIGDTLQVGINNLAHEQIAGHLRIPKPYYDRLRETAPALLRDNVNHWFKKAPEDEKRLVRTMDSKARAFLSNGYRTLDNYDFLEAALPPLTKLGVEIMSCEVTERRLYLKVVDQRVKKDLPAGAKLGEGHHFFRTISPALTLSNSEVGSGALSVLTGVYEGGCTNLFVIKERSTRKYHLGARMDIGEETYQMLSDRTKDLTDQALWSQVRDVVEAAFNKQQFDLLHEKLVATTQNQITGDPVKVVEVTAKKFGFNDDERGSVLRHLIQGGDLSQYGLQAAITRSSQDLGDYDRASEFERIGGQVIELKRGEWQELSKAA